MLVSLNWLNEYVNIVDLTPEQVASALTSLGLEVEGVEKQSQVGPEVVVGQVTTAVPHPNADSLRVCTVVVGAAEPLQIVCGAPNARAGIKVAVAQIGAVLPGDLKIKKSKIRGETSCGMLCSEQELGLGSGHDGIIELPEEAAVGTPVARALGLGDTVLDVSVTPNRPDWLGLIGIARDLAAKLQRPLRLPDLSSVPRQSALRTAAHAQVRVEDPEVCPRFVALAVRDVQAIPSPTWMQKRLTAAGMRPINLIVDASNYAMLEFAQPVHTYDERFVTGQLLEVRQARPGETLTTLDGQPRQLEDGDLVICDEQGPIGLAGIMGGESSEVRPDTRAIIIEAAAFLGPRVRQTARRLGLRTEASARFERGVDVDNLPNVALRVAGLIAEGMAEARAHGQEVPSPAVAEDLIDAYPAEVSKRVVALRLPETRQFLALPHLSKDEVVAILEHLEFPLLDSTDERCLFEVPFFRVDVMREVDLMEEVGRLVGFDKIPYQLPVMSIRPLPEDPFIDFQESARTALATAGFRETISFPFLAAEEIQALGIGEGHPLTPSLSLANPLSEQFRLMQTTLLPGLLRAAAENRRRGVTGARLFECGRGYFNFSGTSREALERHPAWKGLARSGRHLTRRAKGETDRPVERHWVAAMLDQPFHEKTWNAPETAASFFHGKAALLGLLSELGAGQPQLARPDPKDLPFLHPGAAATVMLNGKLAGYVGELHPRAAAALGLGDAAPVVLELDLELVFDTKARTQRPAAEARRFPAVRRDLALLFDQERSHADVLAQVRKCKRAVHLVEARLFDVYTGDALPAGKKSMAYSFAFQSPERTLTDQEVEQEIGALVQQLGETLGATLR